MENFLTNSKQILEGEDVSIQLPVPQENLVNFEKYQDLENKIQILKYYPLFQLHLLLAFLLVIAGSK